MSTNNAGDGLREAVKVTCKKFPTGWLCDVVCHNPAHDEFLHPATPAEVEPLRCTCSIWPHNDCTRHTSPTEPDAGNVALTEAERVFYERIEDSGSTQGLAAFVQQTVRDHVAAREREAAERAGERIARAIEALPGPGDVGIKGWPADQQEAYLIAIEEAARIARAEARP